MITATVAVILICLVATPLINTSAETIVTEMNNPEGIYSVALMSDTGEVTIEPGTNGSIIVNGVEQNQAYNSGVEKMWGESFAIRVQADNEGPTNLQLASSQSFSGTLASIKYSNGTVTFTNGSGVELNIQSSFFLYPDINGDYGEYMTSNTIMSDVHIGKDAKAWIGAAGLNFVLFDITGKSSNIVGNPIINLGDKAVLSAEFIDSESGLTYQVARNPTITYTNTSTSETNTINWMMLYCPIKYIEVSETDGAIRTILSLIPVLLIAALLIGIGYSIANRNE